MKNLLFLILITFYISLNAQSDTIPSYITYKSNFEVINNNAKEAIKKELQNPTYSLFDKMLYCGPKFWAKYNYLPITEGNITFKVPQADGSEKEEFGKLIQTPEDFKILWDEICKDFSNSNYTIRKPTIEELKYYWSIIFFDIEEPIYVVSNNRIKTIVDFSKNTTLIFIEVVK